MIYKLRLYASFCFILLVSFTAISQTHKCEAMKFFKSNNQGVLLWEKHYNDNGDIEKIINYNENGTKIITTISYNANRSIIQESTVGSGNQIKYEKVYKEEKLIKDEKYINDTLHELTLYEYKENQTTKYIYEVNENVNNLFGKEIIIFDSLKRKIQEISIDNSNDTFYNKLYFYFLQANFKNLDISQLTYSSQYTVVVFESEKEILQESFENGIKVSSKEISLNNRGDTMKIVSYNAYHRPILNITYEYDSNFALKRIIRTNYSDTLKEVEIYNKNLLTKKEVFYGGILSYFIKFLYT